MSYRRCLMSDVVVLLLSGIILAAAGSTVDTTPVQLLFSNRKDIQIVPALVRGESGTRGQGSAQLVARRLEDAVAVDYDWASGLVCWSDLAQNQNRESLITCTRVVAHPEEPARNAPQVALGGGPARHWTAAHSEVIAPDGLACDWIGDKLYWVDSADGQKNIEVATYDGKFRKVLYWTGIDQPRGIIVDPHNGYLYWSDWGDEPKIERAGMDGDRSSREIIVSEDIYWPNGLCLDYDTGRIYWVDAKSNYLHSVNTDGSDRRVIIRSNLPHPFAVTAFRGWVYWTDWTEKGIFKLNLVTGREPILVAKDLYHPMDIHVYHPGRQTPATDNYCSERNGGCSQLCLLSPRGEPVCACNTGTALLSDGKSCASGPESILLLARKKDLRKISLDTDDYTDIILNVTNVGRAIAIDYDFVENYVYWTDDDLRLIQRAHLNGSGQEVLVKTELQHPDGIAVDCASRNFFWTDAGTDRIEVARLDGSSRRVLISEDLDEPRGITLDPINGYIYWTDWGRKPKIERAHMDGSGRRTLIDTDVVWPNGVVLDPTDYAHIYWSDAQRDRIEVAHASDGRNRRVLVKEDLPHVFGFTIAGDFLYWTDWSLRTIERANRHTGENRSTIVHQLADLMGIRGVNLTRSNLFNACSYSNGGCTHLCLLSPSAEKQPDGTAGRVCSCPTGQELQNDHLSCVTPNAFLLLTRAQVIRRLSLAASSAASKRGDAVPIVGVSSFGPIDVHVEEKKIIYIDQDQKMVCEAYLNGRSKCDLVSLSGKTFYDMALDWLSNVVYVVDDQRRIVAYRFNAAPSLVVVWKEVQEPRSIALYPNKGLLFFSDWSRDSPHRIIQCRLNGTNCNALVVLEIDDRPHSLSIHFESSRLYWINLRTKEICSIFLNGTGRLSYLRPGGDPVSLTLLGDYVFWYDLGGQSIMRDLYTLPSPRKSTNFTVIKNSVPAVKDLLIFHQSRQQGYSPCRNNNGECEHFCLTSDTGPHQAYCACPSHYSLDENGKTCSAPTSYILLSQQRVGIVRLTGNTQDPHVPLPLKENNAVKALAYDPVDSFIYWTPRKGSSDRTEKGERNEKILRARADGSEFSEFLLTKYPATDLAIDPYSRILFYSYSQNNSINATRLDGGPSLGIIVKQPGVRPRALALSNTGLLFFIDNSPLSPRIASVDLITQEIRTVANASLGYSSGDQTFPLGPDYEAIAVDDTLPRLFFSDIASERIWSCEFHGGGSCRVLNGGVKARALIAFREFLYYSELSGGVFRLSKVSGTGVRQFRTMERVVQLAKAAPALNLAQHPCYRDRNNGGCSHLCVGEPGWETLVDSDTDGDTFARRRTARRSKARCGCPMGMRLVENGPRAGRLCEEIPTCSAQQFMCEASGKCINGIWRCDGQFECLDKSDEKDCEYSCEADEFMCLSGQCIAGKDWCNLHNDCVDKSDEADCCTDEQGRVGEKCTGEWACYNTTQRCNGVNDCKDGGDELRCNGTFARTNTTAAPTEQPSTQPYRVGITVVLCVVAVFIKFIVVFVLWRCRRDGAMSRSFRGGPASVPMVTGPGSPLVLDNETAAALALKRKVGGASGPAQSMAKAAVMMTSAGAKISGSALGRVFTGASSSGSEVGTRYSSTVAGGTRYSSTVAGGTRYSSTVAGGMRRCHPPPPPSMVTDHSAGSLEGSALLEECDEVDVDDDVFTEGSERRGVVLDNEGSESHYYAGGGYTPSYSRHPKPPNTTPCGTDIFDGSSETSGRYYSRDMTSPSGTLAQSSRSRRSGDIPSYRYHQGHRSSNRPHPHHHHHRDRDRGRRQRPSHHQYHHGSHKHYRKMETPVDEPCVPPPPTPARSKVCVGEDGHTTTATTTPSGGSLTGTVPTRTPSPSTVPSLCSGSGCDPYPPPPSPEPRSEC